MEFNQNAPLVFHWKTLEHKPAVKILQGIGVVFVIAAMAILWFLLPPLNLGKIDWSAAWRRWVDMPGSYMIFIYPIVGGIVFWLQKIHYKYARLIVDNDSMRYESGVPLISRWLDWSLDLNAVRIKKIKLQISGNKLGPHPILLYRVSWGVGNVRQVRPSAWVLSNQAAAALEKPITRFGLTNWNSTENAALLQKQFEQLPLINALIQREVDIPKVLNNRELNGLDLMAYPRMKAVVISFFVALAGAFVLFHLMRHQHYFVALPKLGQYAFGAVVGLCTLVWLWTEKLPKDVSTDKAGLRTTQILLAFLMAVPAGLCAPSLPLLVSNLLQSAEEQTFSLQKIPLTLKSKDPTNMPDILPTQAHEYWKSLPEGESVSLPVRKGLAGLWWQYDSSVLQDKVEQFYDAQPRKPSRR